MLRSQVLSAIDLASTYLIAATVLILPFFFLPVTTDALDLPKQLLMVVVIVVLLLLFGARSILEGKFSFRRTPFDLGLAVFFIVILVSAFFSASRATSIISAIPLLALVLFSFLLVNTITDERKQRLVLAAVLLGGAALALFTMLQFLKIYVLPYPVAKIPSFSLSGSLLTSTVFLFALLPIGLLAVRSHFRNPQEEKGVAQDVWGGVFLGVSILIAVGAGFGLYQLVTSAKPLLLPQESGLRTALQPLGLTFQTALFGTGPGTYLFNFTRFRDVALNATDLWNVRFTSSSSLFLEVLSTLGVLGAITFFFLIFRLITSFLRSNMHAPHTVGVFLALVFLFLFSFFLPFSLVLLFLIFMLLGLYNVSLANEKHPSVYDVSVSVVALRKGFISLEREPVSGPQSPATDVLPSLLFGFFVLVSGIVLFALSQDPATGRFSGMYQYVASDITFQRALFAASQNQAQQTYDLQNEAIRTFSQRDMYHRVFSQTNLALAISLSQQARGATPSAVDQQNILTLVQQSINFGRNAVTLSPLNVLNWENLTNVYRNLIGFAQSADQFAISSARQAVALDPANPLLRISLGSIFYQLGQYDLAVNEFSTAVNLKPDHANAYYNLGHAFENKGDAQSLQQALISYQRVRSLVAQDSEDFKKIEAEIAALQGKIPAVGTQREEEPTSRTGQEPLKVSTPSGTLPERKPPVKVEGPPATESGTRQ